MLKNSEFYPKSVRTSGQGLLQQMSELMTNFNDHAETELSASNDLSVLNELSEMLKDIISNIASIIKRNQNDLKETKNHLEESLNQLQSPETKTPKPIFEKIQAFNVSTGYKIGEIKSYHPNYEFSMEIKHQVNSYGYILQGLLTENLFDFSKNIFFFQFRKSVLILIVITRNQWFFSNHSLTKCIFIFGEVVRVIRRPRTSPILVINAHSMNGTKFNLFS